MRTFFWITIYLVIGSGITLARAKGLHDFIVVAQASSSDDKDGQTIGKGVEKIQKELQKLGQDLSKAIAKGEKKASKDINDAIDEAKKKLKKAIESEKKEPEKNK